MIKIIFLLFVFLVGCGDSWTIIQQAFDLQVLNENIDVSLPIDSPKEAVGYAIQNNFVDSVLIEDLKQKGYKNFSITGYLRSPEYKINHERKRLKNKLETSATFRKRVSYFKSIGSYWQVQFDATGVWPSYFCCYYINSQGAPLFGGLACGYNK